MPPQPMVYSEQQQTAAFHVFSIRPKASPEGLNSHADTSRQYITRKSHRKSRLGCTSCKSRRVKCDEQQPVCGRCQRTKSVCNYRADPSISRKKGKIKLESAPEPALLPNRSNLVVPVAKQGLGEIPRSLNQSTRKAFLLKHYETVTGGAQDTITCSDTLVGQKSHEYRMCVLRLAHEYPYLMHAVLASAALHLTFHGVDKYRLVKLSHLQVALSEFQKAIRNPITELEVDAILLTSMMINMHHFSWIESTRPEDSWVFSAEPSRLDWLSVQLGLLPLIISTSHLHATSLLAPAWKIAAYELDGVEGLPAAMARLCGVHDSMTAVEKEENPYYFGLQLLAPLMKMERGSVSLVKYIRFIRSLPKAFFELAQCNDQPALLILSYWFGLMCYVDFWWIIRRAKRDCTALCMYLDNNADHRIRELLDFPAKACGYQIDRPRGFILE